MKYIDREWATILKEVFSATANGFWRVFFQPNEFTVLQDSYAFTFKKPVKNIKLLQMYFVAILNKIFSKYNWENKSWWNKIKEETIHLPTLANWELAYEYMENYIKEIEQYHIKEIEAYLKATGLSDYNLTKDEVDSLRIISEGKGRKFRLDELFEYDRGKESAPRQVEDWDYPMINETSENNWLTKYAKPTKVLKGNSISVLVNFAQTVFYQPKDFCASVNVMSLYNEKFNQLSYMYVITQLRRNHAHFNYWGKISKNRLLEEEITLPVNANNQINYPLIETYIKATQKLVIKDLVDKINEKLTTYEKLFKRKLSMLRVFYFSKSSCHFSLIIAITHFPFLIIENATIKTSIAIIAMIIFPNSQDILVLLKS